MKIIKEMLPQPTLTILFKQHLFSGDERRYLAIVLMAIKPKNKRHEKESTIELDKLLVAKSDLLHRKNKHKVIEVRNQVEHPLLISKKNLGYKKAIAKHIARNALRFDLTVCFVVFLGRLFAHKSIKIKVRLIRTKPRKMS